VSRPCTPNGVCGGLLIRSSFVSRIPGISFWGGVPFFRHIQTIKSEYALRPRSMVRSLSCNATKESPVSSSVVRLVSVQNL